MMQATVVDPEPSPLLSPSPLVDVLYPDILYTAKHNAPSAIPGRAPLSITFASSMMGSSEIANPACSFTIREIRSKVTRREEAD